MAPAATQRIDQFRRRLVAVGLVSGRSGNRGSSLAVLAAELGSDLRLGGRCFVHSLDSSTVTTLAGEPVLTAVS